MKVIVLSIQTLCWILIYMNNCATTNAHKTTPSFVNRDQYENDLLGIIRRVQDLESCNEVIKYDNKKLKEEVSSLRTFISILAEENEKTVSDLQSQITDLKAKNQHNELIIQSLVSARETDKKENESNLKVQMNSMKSENKDFRNDMIPSTIRANSKQHGERLHKRQKKGHSVTNNSVRGSSHKHLAGPEGHRIARAENEAKIAFYATIGEHDILHVGVNQTIVFDNVITNLGNAYNKFGGDFRAPVPGTYVFSLTLMAYGTHSTHYHITKNRALMGRIYLNGKEGRYATSAMTVVLELKQGDAVSIQNVDADEHLNGYAYSTFAGFLLQQDYSTAGIVGK